MYAVLYIKHKIEPYLVFYIQSVLNPVAPNSCSPWDLIHETLTCAVLQVDTHLERHKDWYNLTQ